MEAAGKRWITHGSRLDKFRIWNLSDLHVGAKGCAEGKLRADVKRIAEDPFSFWLGGGDYAEFIGYSDKRFDPDAVADWVSVKDLGDLGMKSMKRVRDILMPIRGRALGLLCGNHEKKYELRTEHDSLHGWLCAELDAPNLGYCCLFDIAFWRTKCKAPQLHFAPPKIDLAKATANVFRIFAHHGAGYAITPGGKLNKLISAMNSFEADLYFLGHVHDQVARKEPVIGANGDCTKLVQRTRLGLISGSFLTTYTQGSCSYGEQKMYRATHLGAAVARITPDTREIEAAL